MEKIYEREWGYYQKETYSDMIPEGMPQEEIAISEEKVVYTVRNITNYWQVSEKNQKDFKPKMYYYKFSYYKDGKYTFIKNGVPKKINVDKYFNIIYNKMFDIYTRINDKELFIRFKVGQILQSFLENNYPLLKDMVNFMSEQMNCYDYRIRVSTNSIITYSKVIKVFDYCMEQPKSIKKYLLSKKDINKMFDFYDYKYVGIKDCNILLSLISNNKITITFLTNFRKAQRFYIKCLKNKYGDAGEKIYAKRIINLLEYNRDLSIFIDTFKFLNTYLYIKSKKDKNLKLIPEEEIAVLSIKKLHDEIFRRIRTCCALYRNPELAKPLEMTDEHILMDNVDIQGVTFTVPKTLIDFSNLSNFFNNCVVTYYAKALRKQCYIISAVKGNEPFACIELNKDKMIMQCLGYSNKRLKEEDMMICNEYFNLIGAKKYFYSLNRNNNNNIIDELELPF